MSAFQSFHLVSSQTVYLIAQGPLQERVQENRTSLYIWKTTVSTDMNQNF